MDLKNDRLLRALLRQPVDRTPVWIMRQAGRYLPEYLATRAQAGNFMNLCQTPELACEVTLQPLRRYDLDAAIIFSDILTIPDAMGLGLYFSEGEGPRFEKPVRSLTDVHTLHVPDPDQDLGYVMSAVSAVRGELGDRLPLIGFAGSPWTLATYMVEGGSSRSFGRVKAMLYEEPAAAHRDIEIAVGQQHLPDPAFLPFEQLAVGRHQAALAHGREHLLVAQRRRQLWKAEPRPPDRDRATFRLRDRAEVIWLG